MNPFLPCSVPGCNEITNRRYKKIYYCRKHLVRILSFGEAEPTKFKNPIDLGFQKCNCCGEIKNIEDYYKDNHARFGVSRICKLCVNNKDKEREDNLKLVIPTNVIKNIKPYPLRNPVIKKHKTGMKSVCKCDGCNEITSVNWKYCTKHAYLIKKFGELKYPEELTCSHCLKTKPYNEFIDEGHTIHGRMKCNECVKELKRQKNISKRKKFLEKLKKDPKKWSEYSKKKNYKKAQRIKNNPTLLEKKRLSHRTVDHNRRARLNNAGGTHTKKDIDNMMIMQKYKCAVCKKSVRNKFHIDHIIPIAKGGGSMKENIQILCPDCNQRKSDLDSHEFMQRKGYLL